MGKICELDLHRVKVNHHAKYLGQTSGHTDAHAQWTECCAWTTNWLSTNTEQTNLLQSCMYVRRIIRAVVVNLRIEEDGFTGHVASLVECHGCGDGAALPAAAFHLCVIAQPTRLLTAQQHSPIT